LNAVESGSGSKVVGIELAVREWRSGSFKGIQVHAGAALTVEAGSKVATARHQRSSRRSQVYPFGVTSKEVRVLDGHRGGWRTTEDDEKQEGDQFRGTQLCRTYSCKFGHYSARAFVASFDGDQFTTN